MNGPLIVQSDMTLLLETEHEQYDEAREAIVVFAEMVKCPEYIHTYLITPLSLWNAASAGVLAEDVIKSLDEYAKRPVADGVKAQIMRISKKYGKVKIEKEGTHLYLVSEDEFITAQMSVEKKLLKYLKSGFIDNRAEIDPCFRGHIKQVLIDLQLPPEDLAGYAESSHLQVNLRYVALSGQPFSLRQYQQAAVRSFLKSGHGTIVLPCGAGKTIVGMGAISEIKSETLIITTSITALRQWITELLDKTTLTEDQIGEYSGEKKDIKPVTVSTYQILSAKNKDEEREHFSLFEQRSWGFIIYDEVHTLPAPMFRITAELQAKRRLGLTATLVREDKLETDVFALIGPKRHEVSWKVLENKGFIAEAVCYEIRVALEESKRMPYAVADKRDKFRIASENPNKLTVLYQLLNKHKDDHVLIIGQYINQLNYIAESLGVPVIMGKTSNKKREELYSKFKRKEIPVMVVSKVANFAIDLPDANVAIEVSGMFGSRQEEAQRLGRILRPKRGENRAWFYTLVSEETCEEEFASHRQLFLIEQGYPYEVLNEDELFKSTH